MAIKQHLKKLVGQAAARAEMPWRPIGTPYPMLAGLDAAAMGLDKVAGLLAIWHLGVRPQWLKVASCADLGAAVRSAQAAPAIMSYAPNGGIYIAWAPMPPALLAGPAVHLIARLEPTLQSRMLEQEVVVKAGIKPVAIDLPPGAGR
jgi:hypothetical protein